MQRSGKVPRILCLGRSGPEFDSILRAIRASGYKVLLALTAEQGVALAVAQYFAAVVLASDYLRDTEWSVAKSLKIIRPSLPILLLDSRRETRKSPPSQFIDAVAGSDSTVDVIRELEEILK